MAAQPDVKELLRIAKEHKAVLDGMLANKTAQERVDIKSTEPYKQKVKLLREANTAVQELKTKQREYLDTLIKQEGSAKKLTGIYSSLGAIEQKRLQKQGWALNMDKEKATVFNKIADLNQTLAGLTAEDVIQRADIKRQLDDEFEKLEGVRGIHSHIRKELLQEQAIAESLSNLTDKQKTFLEKQIKVYDTLKDTIGGILETAKLLVSTPFGIIGSAIMGAGYAAEALGKTVRAMGGYMGGVTLSTTALGLVFKDAQATAEGLNAELGGMRDVTFQTQLNTNLMATNMGISGQEAAALTGNFARMNGNSTSIAADMAESTKQLAKSKGVMPSAVMKDVAKSTKAFAEYGKDGGKNIGEAAVAAARLGVSMDSMTKVADHLLDFESSINDELELGAMLGKNINLNNARDLAYRGQIGAAVKDALHQLGGVDAYNRMDVFQKRQAAKALGLSTEELDKMVKNQDKLNDDGTMQLSTFDSWSQSLSAFASGPLGSVLKGMGGAIIAAGQLNGGLGALGFSIKGMVGGTFQVLKNLIGMLMPTKLLAASKAFGNWVAGSKLGKAVGGIKDKLFKGVGESKGPDLSNAAKTTEASDKMSKGKGGVGDKLKDLAKGLKEMGNGKVLFGALNLIPTGLGFLGMIPGLPTLFLLSKMDVSGVGKGLGELAKGLKKMGDGKVLFGALSLSLAGLAFTVMTLGVIGMAAVALLGIPTGVALTALGKGFKSFGDNALKGVLVFGLLAGVIGLSALAFQQFAGVDWTSVIFGGIALAAFALGAFAISKVANDIIKGSIAIAILGIALIPFTYAMSLLAGLSMESVAAAAVGLVLFAGAVFALGAIMFSGVGALVFGAGILALIALGGALMILGVGISVLAGGMTALNGVLGPIATSISTIMTSLGGILGMIGPIALLSTALFGLGASMIFLGSAGLIALPGITALAAIQTITVGLASILGLDAGGAGKDGKDAKMDELINEIKGLRADMEAGKIQVHMDGQKVTSGVSKVVDRLTGNSYKHA
jgi:hypothetical protein